MRPHRYDNFNLRKKIEEHLDVWGFYDNDYYITPDYGYLNYGYYDGVRLKDYSIVDMDTIYNREKLRDIKIDRILNPQKDYTTRLEDFYNRGKNESSTK